jgi:hypothetical protein
MKGRDQVPFGDLIEELRETLREREHVAALIQDGTPGPYLFQRTIWDRFDPFRGMDLFSDS